MTISTENRKAGPFNGNGSASAFPFAFKVFSSADLVVVVRDDATGVETTLALTSGYTVSLNADQNASPGGSVTLVAGALATGKTLVISSSLQYLQPTDLTNQGGFYPKVITNALDRLTIFCQQLAQGVKGSFRLPITADSDISTELPIPEANKIVGWDSTAKKLRNVGAQELATISSYGTTNADQFTGDGSQVSFVLSASPGSVNNMDVSVSGVTLRPEHDYTWDAGTTITFTTAPAAPSVSGAKNILVRYNVALPNLDTGPIANAISGHEAKLSAHPISGVSGLQTELNALSASDVALAARVTTLEARKSTCLVNATGTGAPHETVSTALPASISNNTRYVLANPYGNNVPVICWAEIKINGNWCDPSFALADTNAGYGVKATFKQGEGVIVQTGGTGLIAQGNQTGTGHPVVSGLITSAPCRVFIRRADD
jgi:hypothetical protein